MYSRLLVLLLCFVTLACSATPLTPTASPTLEPTPTTPRATPTPEPTTTPVPLSQLDLRPILYQEGDLPPGFSPAQIRDFAPSMYDDLPQAEQELYLQFERDDEAARGLAVFLYASKEDLRTAYELVISGLVDPVSSDAVGEQAALSRLVITGLGAVEVVDVVYTRCSALVNVSMVGTSDIDAALAYSRNLDKRIESLVCP